jgi:hypothetical protein
MKNRIIDELPGITAGIILFGLIWCIGYLASHHRNSTEKRFGFCTLTPDMKLIPCHIEPLMIRCVEKGSAFEKAGFNDRDILVLPRFKAVGEFHRYLKKPEGTIIELMVIPYNKFKPECEADNWGEPEKRVVIAP